MKHATGRKLLRGMNREERRQTISGMWLIPHDGHTYSIRSDGLPERVPARWASYDDAVAISEERLKAVWDMLK